MQFYLAAVCASFLVHGAVYDFTPEQRAQVYMVFDGDMDTQRLYEATNMTVSQFESLYEVYEQAGLTLEVAAELRYSTDPATCGWYTPMQNSHSKLKHMVETTVSGKAHIHEALDGNHLANNAIWVATKRFTKHEEDTRRVIIEITDRVQPFGDSGDKTETCATKPISQDTFTRSIESVRAGLLYSIISDQSLQIQKEGNELYKTSAGLTDLFVDEFGESATDFDTVEWHLRRLLSPQWVASTSTTTSSTTTSTTTKRTTSSTTTKRTTSSTTPKRTTTLRSTATAAPSLDEVIEGCKSAMESSTDEWLEDCQTMCEFYAKGSGTAWCGVPESSNELIECVLKYHSDHCSTAE